MKKLVVVVLIAALTAIGTPALASDGPIAAAGKKAVNAIANADGTTAAAATTEKTPSRSHKRAWTMLGIGGGLVLASGLVARGLSDACINNMRECAPSEKARVKAFYGFAVPAGVFVGLGVLDFIPKPHPKKVASLDSDKGN